ncbi:translesion DNA synthesis-associated protein ImuA [Marinobacter salicampi]|uniref:translesion DNA synthesis-associated protein ImuA n=1 Tax=Marinobacter salicampi TaxID=435907 RepID=UPI00140AEE13|nr:translesion DNA synthesis-associated protein ImuA [Marinobacter salicampi]
MKELLDTLISDARVWQGSQQAQTTLPAEPTGFSALDLQLAGVGWPRGALTECLLPAPGIGELQLVLPLMRRQLEAGKTVFWINPPYTPYAPALEREGLNLAQIVVVHTQDQADALWSLENCLRSPVTGLVMAWPTRLKSREMRRLQLAAEAGDSLCILFRPTGAADNSSPAALRLQLEPGQNHALDIRILKRRGGWAAEHCTLALPDRAPVRPDTATSVVRGPWPERNR